jgi:hypothetical protein
MNICLEQFEGDLLKFLVMLVISLRTTKHRDFASRTQEELLSGAIPVLPGFGANARSIAEAIGLPKETIRRRVTDLLADGWLVRENGKLYCTARSYRELAPIREQIELIAVRYYDVVSALKQRSEDAVSEVN